MSTLDNILGEMRIKLIEKEKEKLTENLLANGEYFWNNCAFDGNLCL